MLPKNRGQGLCIELAINIFGVMTAYWVRNAVKNQQETNNS